MRLNPRWWISGVITKMRGPAPRRKARDEKEPERASLSPAEMMKDFLEFVEARKTALAHKFPVKIYEPPDGVVPSAQFDKLRLAADAAFNVSYSQAVGEGFTQMDATGFPGYPFLANLAQISEYRDMSERVANEMVRKWVKLRSKSKKDQTKVIAAIESEMQRLKVRDLFRDAAIRDGWFGRCQIFMDFGEAEGDELKTTLMLNPHKIGIDSLRGLKVVEPISTYPAAYNAANPLRQDYYRPSAWFVYGQEVHDSRMLNFVSRPLPDILKPVFNFGGMSMSQLAMPYVDYWISTRSNVGEILKNFRTTIFTTDMSDALTPGGDAATTMARLKVFSASRDNFGVFAVDKGKEESVEQLNTPLSGLRDLQAAAQEHMAAVSKTPLVVMLGVSPAGLNASSEGEMRAFNDHVRDLQEVLFRSNLEKLIKVIMLSKLGYMDDDITFDFVPLMEMTEKERALIRKSNADAGVEYIMAGVVDPLEERKRLAADPDSGYDNLDVDSVPMPPSPESMSELKEKSAARQGVEQGAEEGAEIGTKDELLAELRELLP